MPSRASNIIRADDTSPNPVGRPWPSRLSGALLGALSVGLGTLIIEALRMTRGPLTLIEGALAAAPVASVIVLWGLAVGVLVSTLLGLSVATAWMARNLTWRRLIRWGTLLVLLGYAGFGFTKLAHALLAAEGTRAIAVAWLFVPTAIVLVLVSGVVSRLFSRRLPERPTPTQALWTCLFGSAAWALSLFVTEPEVFWGVSGIDWAPMLLAPLASIAAALHLPLHRWLLAAQGVLGALLITASVIDLASDPSARTELAIAEHSRTTRLVADVFASVAPSETEAVIGDSGGGTCWPDEQQSPLHAVGTVDEDAPDILLVMFDAVRWDHTTLGGYKKNTTPNLKRYADRSVVFERAYSNSASTRQTFRSLLSGLLPSQVAPSKGKTKWALSFPEEQHTLASYLRAGGYETISIQTTRAIDEIGTPPIPGFEVRDFAPYHARRTQGYSANVHIDRVIAHLSEGKRKRPRFVFTHMMEAHQPFIPGPHPKRFGKGRKGRYDSAVHMIDRQLGRIIEFALSPERRDDTILILAADHGMGLGGRGGMKQHGNSLYDDQTHVPLLFFGPGFDARRIDAPATLLDLFPTVLDLAGLAALPHVCGTSLKEVLRGEDYEERPVVVEIFADRANPKFRVAYIDGRYKLMLDVKAKTRTLYDLEADPKEREDLSASEPKTLDRMEKGLRQFLAKRGRDPAVYDL